MKPISKRYDYDAVVVGSGPNGLTAATLLARKGLKTLVVEKAPEPGGGARTSELMQPGFYHDTCSAVHPTGWISPAFTDLNLEGAGLEWIYPPYSAAHPLDGGKCIILEKDVHQTAQRLGPDQEKYVRAITPLLKDFPDLFPQLLDPLSLRKDIISHIRFGSRGILPASQLANLWFKGPEAKALFAGCAAHSILPFSKWGTAAVGLVFLLLGHMRAWPIPKGGSGQISKALLQRFQEYGGELQCDTEITDFDQLPTAKHYLFDLAPAQIGQICESQLKPSYLRALQRYNYGPGAYKIDYILSSQIPWTNSESLKASTVHVGGTLEEIANSEEAAWKGKQCDKPFVMVCQQSHFDTSRAPAGYHTGYAYCHVPNGSTLSMEAAIESQIERFAPGFKEYIVAKQITTPSEFQRLNPSYIGGAITGGANTLSQLATRPVTKLNPYRTSNANIYICSHSTPPGGGVHGLCGRNAVRTIPPT